MIRSRMNGLFLLLFLLLALEVPASAYTDPGSGALLWQMLVAAFMGSLFYARRVVAWFRRPKK